MPIAHIARVRPSVLQSQYMRLFASMLLVLVAASLLAAQQTAAPDAAAIPPNSQVTTQAQSQGQASQAGSGSAATQAIPAAQPDSPTPAASQPQSINSPGEVSTAPPGTPILPMVTPREATEAKRQFQAGVKLKSKGHLDAAFGKFSSASELDPRNLTLRDGAGVQRAGSWLCWP